MPLICILEIGNHRVLCPEKLNKLKITFENLLFQVIINGPDLFLSLEEVLQLNAIEEVKVILDSLEGLSDRLFESLLAFNSLFLEFGYVLEVLFLHELWDMLSFYKLKFILFRFKKLLNFFNTTMKLLLCFLSEIYKLIHF